LVREDAKKPSQQAAIRTEEIRRDRNYAPVRPQVEDSQPQIAKVGFAGAPKPKPPVKSAAPSVTPKKALADERSATEQIPVSDLKSRIKATHERDSTEDAIDAARSAQSRLQRILDKQRGEGSQDLQTQDGGLPSFPDRRAATKAEPPPPK